MGTSFNLFDVISCVFRAIQVLANSQLCLFLDGCHNSDQKNVSSGEGNVKISTNNHAPPSKEQLFPRFDSVLREIRFIVSAATFLVYILATFFAELLIEEVLRNLVQNRFG